MRGLAGLLALVLSSLGSSAANATASSDSFDEAREVLEARCLSCHGGAHRESGLSFADGGTFREGGARGEVLDHEDLAASRLLHVVSYADPDLAMPPSGLLTEAEREALRRWVHEGAPWPADERGRLADPEKHPREAAGVHEVGPWWAYDALERPAVPTVHDPEWSRPIDAFLAAEFGELEPSPRARADTLLRRAHFDLTGLPPSLDESQAFKERVREEGFDTAWHELLDELLASPHYGEHQARRWLDLVRYGETNGYERDAAKRNVWRYRDWVVRAMNDDVPFDEFGRLQIAADELPEAPADAVLATGYYRLGVWDDEPADREQARADELADVVDTTSQVFMGTTMGCSRCHDHKADPILQKEYFELTAHFAGVVGYGGGGFSQSLGAGATREVADLARDGVLETAERDRLVAAVDARLEQLGRELGLDVPEQDVQARTLVADARSEAASWHVLEGPAPDGWTSPGFDDSSWREDKAGFGAHGTPGSHIGTEWKSERIQLRTSFYLDVIPEALRLTLHHDDDARIYLNGVEVTHVRGYRVDYGAYQLDADARNALVVGRNVLAVECIQDFGGQYVDVGLDTRWDVHAIDGLLVRLRDHVRGSDDSTSLVIRDLFAERERLLETPVTTPYPAQIVFERPDTPDQFVHLRGSVHAPGEHVEPGLPLAWTVGSAGAAYEVPPRVEGAPTAGRRRALADWLFTGGRHVAARVEVNRVWQALFGRGLCPTPGDFGRLGELPSHPDLLDWLAVEFVEEHEWSRKGLLRQLMTSRAYLGDSQPTTRTRELDPTNRQLARTSPRRLTAEEYRDAVLAVAGELNPKMFGPSVFPPLSHEVLATASRPGAAWGDARRGDAERRSLYVHVKRSLRHPLLASLDQPDPDLPCPARFPTNVPTQALLTLNGDFTNRVSARFARDLEATTAPGRERLTTAIERAFARRPRPGEVNRATTFLEHLVGVEGLDEARALEVWALGLFNQNEFFMLD